MINNTMYTQNTRNTRKYTVSEVSQLYNVSEDTVRRMIKDGRLDGQKIGYHYLITEDSIKRLVKGENE